MIPTTLGMKKMQGQAGGEEDLRDKRRHFHGLFILACSMRYGELSDAERSIHPLHARCAHGLGLGELDSSGTGCRD